MNAVANPDADKPSDNQNNFKKATSAYGLLIGLGLPLAGAAVGYFRPELFAHTAYPAQPLAVGFLAGSIAAVPASLFGTFLLANITNPKNEPEKEHPAVVPTLVTGLCCGIGLTALSATYMYAADKFEPKQHDKVEHAQIMEAPSATSMLAQKGIHLSL